MAWNFSHMRKTTKSERLSLFDDTVTLPFVYRGDYRSGKRLNMRKVIPYIASQFRKDKIWLRRTKPSKRQYQIMLAVDDSSSMNDNRSKQVITRKAWGLLKVANSFPLSRYGLGTLLWSCRWRLGQDWLTGQILPQRRFTQAAISLELWKSPSILWFLGNSLCHWPTESSSSVVRYLFDTAEVWQPQIENFIGFHQN